MKIRMPISFVRALGVAALLIVLGAAAGAPSAAAAPFIVFSPGDPILDDLRYLARLSGRSLLSFTPPLSRDEVLNILKDAEGLSLEGAGAEAYRRVSAALNPEPLLHDGALGFDLDLALNLEGRARTNGDLPWTRSEAGNPALLSLPLQFFLGKSVYAAGSLVLRTDPSFYEEGSSAFAGNVPYDPSRLDLNMPLRSFLSAGGPWWNFQIGRDKASFGSGKSGNLSLSDTPDFYDFARFSLFSPNFKYSLFVTQLPLSISDFLSDGSIAAGYGAKPYLRATNQRYLYLHRWDFRLWKRLSLGLGEGVLVGDSPLELRYLNPLAMYHSYFAWRDYPKWGSDPDSDMVGSLFSVDLEWAPLPSWAVYGQFVMNQYATAYELKRWPEDNSPNGLGWLFGVEHSRDFSGTRASFHFEALYTDPYLYMLSSPFASYIWMRRLSELSSKDLRYAWTGHPEGRDTILLAVGADFLAGPHGLSLGLSYAAKGRRGLIWDWAKGEAAVEETTPSGIAMNRWIASGAWRFQATPRLNFASYIAFSVIQNSEHRAGSTEIGAELALSAGYTFY